MMRKIGSDCDSDACADELKKLRWREKIGKGSVVVGGEEE